jgi:hypothetical protein
MIASLLHISTGCGWWKIPEELGGVVYSDAAPVGSLINTNSLARRVAVKFTNSNDVNISSSDARCKQVPRFV